MTTCIHPKIYGVGEFSPDATNMGFIQRGTVANWNGESANYFREMIQVGEI